MQDTHVLDSLKVNSYVSSMDHDIFIDEDIENEAYYRSVISTLNKATEKDTLRFIISSNGGFGSTAMTLAHAMDSCPARKVGVLCGNVKSAATIIALHCTEWEVGAGCDWMAHTASFGLGGSAHTVQKYHDHEQAQIKKLLYREYEGFYTEDEIADIAAGNDSLLFAEEVQERLGKYVDYHQTKHNQALEDSYTQQFAEEDAMVEEALAALQIPVAEREVFDKISSQLEDYFSQEQPAAKETPVVSEETASMLQEVVETLTAAEDEQVIEITNGDNYFLLHYRYDEEDEVVELELQTEDDELIVISKYALDDYERSFLLNLAKSLGVKWSHNSGKVTLIDNIVDYLEGLLS